MYSTLLGILGLLLLNTSLFSQDPNFYIYVCFGQSNMEGQGPIETPDKTVDSRFKVFQALTCSNLNRTEATWYKAVPPTCQCYSKLSPADYFGRTMVANLPDSITVGIINVSVAGCDIRLFDKDIYMDYDSTYTDAWFLDRVTAYGGNPYQYLIDLARLAQQDGVIKGILLHQGETNTGDTKWPGYVQKIYNDMLADLSLVPDSVPLLAGEVVSVEQNGCCSSMNNIINKLPATIPTAYVISSKGCTDLPDNTHFNSEGYRTLGRRYGVKMLSLFGYEAVYAEAECGTLGDSCAIRADKKASNASFVTLSPGAVNISQAPADDARLIHMSFSLGKDTSYYIYGRFNNAGSDKDSYWIKIDDSAYELLDNLTTSGWQWLELKSIELTAGQHSISIAFGESGAQFDKLVIKNSHITPVDVGEEAKNVCTAVISTVGLDLNSVSGYSLDQNYPNPFCGNTSFSFKIPYSSYVSLKVFNSLGAEIAELAGKEMTAGRHTLNYNLENLSSGNYYYTLTADKFTATRDMIIMEQ